jgi:hypothetical protein
MSNKNRLKAASPAQIKEYYKKIGAKGGKARAKKYDSEQRSKWSRHAMKSAPQCLNAVPKRKRHLIREALLERKGDRTIGELAKEIGCSLSYLSYVLKGKRPPGPKIQRYLGAETLKALGLEPPGKAA